MGTRYYSIVCSTFFKLKNIYSVILEALCFKNGEGFVFCFFLLVYLSMNENINQNMIYIFN